MYPNEKYVNTLDLRLRRMYTLQSQYCDYLADFVEMGDNARGDDAMVIHAAIIRRIADIAADVKLVKMLFWRMVIKEFSIEDEPDLGIRKGWKVVRMLAGAERPQLRSPILEARKKFLGQSD